MAHRDAEGNIIEGDAPRVTPQVSALAATYKIPVSVAGALINVSRDLGIQPEWLANVIVLESQWNPKAVNTISGASGLIQFMPKTAQELGTTVARIRAMSATQQLELAKRYFLLPRIRNKGRLRSQQDVAMAIFYPAAIGKPSSWVFPKIVRDVNPVTTVHDYMEKLYQLVQRRTGRDFRPSGNSRLIVALGAALVLALVMYNRR
jgi:hypothetical protein